MKSEGNKSEKQRLKERGLRFKELRNALGKSQTELAEELGVSQGAISKWESGIRSIPDSVLEYLAKNYRVNLHWLLLGEGSMFLNPVTGEIPPEKAGIDKELAVMISMLSPEQQESLKLVFKEFLKKGGEKPSSSSLEKPKGNAKGLMDSHSENVIR